MIDLVLQVPHVDQFLPDLVDSRREGCVILLTREATRRNGTLRLLSASFVIPETGAYLRRGPLEAQLSPDFVARAAKKARQEQCGLVFVHSHPGKKPPRFSSTDDEGEQHLAAFLKRRLPEATHAALVLSAGGAAARVLGSSETIRVVEVGVRRRVVSEGVRPQRPTELSEHDRQVRALGSEGQRRLSQLSVGIVGLGGTGSLVVQQLAHLGVKTFTLVDPDMVELTNLNRLAGAIPSANAEDLTADRQEAPADFSPAQLCHRIDRKR